MQLLLCLPPMLCHAGGKKTPKVYRLHVHPLQPQLVAAATNTGTALLSLEHLPPLAAAPLPLHIPTQVLSPAGGVAALPAFGDADMAAGSGATYVAAYGDSIVCVTTSAVSPVSVPLSPVLRPLYLPA